MKKEKTLTYGTILSLLLLALFGRLQIENNEVLNLPSHWLAVAVLPLLVALFAGGFITRFKGFGVELETTLKAPVASLNLTASDIVADISCDEKRSSIYLDGLSTEKKLAPRWLLFRSGRKKYYTPDGVKKYLSELPNIEYFEIKSESGKFVCFIPISVFRSLPGNDNMDYDKLKLQKLIDAIEEDNVPNTFSDSAITLKVPSEQGLVDVLRKLRSEKAGFAAVVSPSGKYLGVVFANDVERKIADSVLAIHAA